MKRIATAGVLLLGVLLGGPAGARAQVLLRGTVTDQQTGAPLTGAAVRVTGTDVGTVTNEAGAFTLRLGGPVSSVTVSSIGYETRTVTVADASQVLHVALVPAAVPVPGIRVVTVRPTPGAAVLTQRELERGNELRLETSVNTEPGVFMQSRTPWGGARITIRGYYPSTSGNSPNSNGLGYRVFLNDIPITDAAGVTILDDIDFSTLGRVEIVKGPASTEYGSYIGGAVRFTTERPAPGEASLRQQVLGGRYGLLRTNTTFQKATDHSALMVNYGWQAYDSFRPHSASQKHYVTATGDFRVADGQTISTFFAYDRSFEELAGEIDAKDLYAREPRSNAFYLGNDSHLAVNGFVAGATDRMRLGDRFSNRTTVYGSGRTSDVRFAHGVTDNTEFGFGARTVFGYTGRIGAGVGVNGSLGGALQRSDITTNGVFIIPIPSRPTRPTDQQNYATNASLFSEWTLDLPAGTWVTAGAGVHWDEFGIQDMLRNGQLFDSATVRVRSFDAVFTPRVSIAKRLGGSASVYASVSSGYAPPLLSNAVANDGSVNLALDPERAVQYEVGAQGSLFANRLSGSVALFDIENTDKLVSATSNSVTYTTNAGKQRNRGAELSVSLLAVDHPAAPLSRVRPWLTYAYTDAEFVDFRSDLNGTAATVDFSGNAVPRVPKNALSAGLDVAVRGGIYANATYRWVDKVPVTFDNSTFVNGYDLLGVKAGVQRRLSDRWNVNLFAGADNLTSSTHYAFLFVGPDIEGLALEEDGGHGDGYLIPAPYHAAWYGSLALTWTPRR